MTAVVGQSNANLTYERHEQVAGVWVSPEHTHPEPGILRSGTVLAWTMLPTDLEHAAQRRASVSHDITFGHSVEVSKFVANMRNVVTEDSWRHHTPCYSAPTWDICGCSFHTIHGELLMCKVSTLYVLWIHIPVLMNCRIQTCNGSFRLLNLVPTFGFATKYQMTKCGFVTSFEKPSNEVNEAHISVRHQTNKQNSVACVCERTMPTKRKRLVGEVSANFCGYRCHVVSVTDPYVRILGFLDRIRCFSFQVTPELYSRGWVDPVSDPLLLRKSGRAGNRTRTSGSVARNSDHQITGQSVSGICWQNVYCEGLLLLRLCLTSLRSPLNHL
jgi:hypothetical protein